MKVSELIGRQAASTDGERQAYVIGVSAAGNKIEYIMCADEAEREFAVCYDDVKSFGQPLTFERGTETKTKAAALRLGMACYGEDGKFLGYLDDYETDGNALKYARIGRKKVDINCLTCGDVILVKHKRVLRGDVIKNGRVIIARGTELCGEVLDFAKNSGEYIQTNLKGI